jgi:cytochrome P450
MTDTLETDLIITEYETAASVIKSEEFGATDAPPDGSPFVAGSVLHMNGSEHRARRRIEAPLFAKSAVLRYESDVLIAATHRQIERQHAESLPGELSANLVEVSRRIMLEVAAALIGLDETDDAERLGLLEECMYPLTEAVELKWTERDHTEVVREGLAAKEIFAREFLHPAISRRLAIEPQRRPLDLIAILLSTQDFVDDPDLPCREAIVFLAGATLTTSTAIVATVLELERWFEMNPDDRRLTTNDAFLLSATNETLRLQPTAPYLPKQALKDTVLPDGRRVAEGQTVLIDRTAINRDTTVFGDDAGVFNPHRQTPSRIAPYGLAFGGGRHQCIGKPLVSDVRPGGEGEPRRAMPVIVAALYEHGMRLDPTRSATRAASAQHRFASVPVLFTTP